MNIIRLKIQQRQAAVWLAKSADGNDDPEIIRAIANIFGIWYYSSFSFRFFKNTVKVSSIAANKIASHTK